MYEREYQRESQQSRQSNASTSKTNERKSAGSGVAISAPRQGSNSNMQQTKKAPGQATSLARGVRWVSKFQDASSSILDSITTFSTVSNSGITGPGSLFGTGKIRNGLFLNGYNSDQGNFGTVVIRNGENSEKTVCNNE